MKKSIKVAISQGDCNGIGYEVILKCLADSRIEEMCSPILYGSAKMVAYHRKALELPTLNYTTITQASQATPNKVSIIECVDTDIMIELGKSTAQAGKAAYDALQAAANDVMEGSADVLVTGPINKHNIQSNSFSFPGHTEYLEEKWGKGEKSLMILLNDTLRVALVTGHIPLADVTKKLTQDVVTEKLRNFNRSLIRDFNIVRPRIAVLSLNPHAGEEGLLGNEEIEIIKPAMKEAEKQHRVLSFGPFPADGFFGSGEYKKYDGILAMYHDQGLAPFKTLAMEDGVNFTAGLPYIRTSPAHGTAYEIAGKNMADDTSFRQAIYVAIDIYRNRLLDDERTENPLKKHYIDRSGDREKVDMSRLKD